MEPKKKQAPPNASEIFGMSVVPCLLDRLAANDWNPNVMDEANRQATLHSLLTFGFVIPIVAREAFDLEDGTLQIIDGQHRWELAREIHILLTKGDLKIRTDAIYDEERGYLRPDGERLSTKECCPHPTMIALLEYEVIPVINMGRIANVVARQLTLVLNEVHGTAQTVRTAYLLEYIHRFDSDEYIARTLAWSKGAVADRIAMARFDWQQFHEQRNTERVSYGAATYKRLGADLTTDEHALIVKALDTLLEDADLDKEMPRNRQLGIALVRLAGLHVPQQSTKPPETDG